MPQVTDVAAPLQTYDQNLDAWKPAHTYDCCILSHLAIFLAYLCLIVPCLAGWQTNLKLYSCVAGEAGS